MNAPQNPTTVRTETSGAVKVGGPPSAGAMLLRRGSLALLVVSGGALAWAALRPFPEPGEQRLVVNPPKTLEPRPRGGGDGEALAALARGYAFSLTREARAELDVDAPQDKPEDRAPIAVPTAPASGTPGVRLVQLDDPSKAAALVKSSYDSLTLRGIYTKPRAEGETALAAQISFRDTPDPTRARTIAVGETFTVPTATNKNEITWTLLAIDARRNRVVVRHEDLNLGLALFETGPLDTSPVEISSDDAGPAPTAVAQTPEAAKPAEQGPKVEVQSRAAILRELAERGVSIQESDDVMAELAKLIRETQEAMEAPKDPPAEAPK